MKEKKKNHWETRAVKEVKGVAFWQVLTLQGNNEEEILSEGEWQAVASTGWTQAWCKSLQGEREEGRRKEITLKWGGGGEEKYCMQNQRSEQQYRQETSMTEGRHFGSLFILFTGAVNGGGEVVWNGAGLQSAVPTWSPWNSGVQRTHKLPSSSRAGLTLRPINKDMTLRNADVFSQMGACQNQGLCCAGLDSYWLSYWVIKTISSKSLPVADDELEKQ